MVPEAWRQVSTGVTCIEGGRRDTAAGRRTEHTRAGERERVRVREQTPKNESCIRPFTADARTLPEAQRGLQERTAHTHAGVS